MFRISIKKFPNTVAVVRKQEATHANAFFSVNFLRIEEHGYVKYYMWFK